MIAAALCAVAMLMLRSIKYRMIDGMAFEMLRYAWYLYYVPMTLMPALFLMTCIRIERGENSRFDERLLLILTGVIILLFLTNDLHYFAFRPVGEQNQITGANGSYTNAPLFYIYYAFFAVYIIAGLVLLTKANSRSHSFIKIALPFIFLLIMAALVMLDKVLNIANKPSMFTMPEIIAFYMVGVFESCIRNRLIPYNENYSGFFAQMQFPAMIADDRFCIVHRSATRALGSLPAFPVKHVVRLLIIIRKSL